MRRPRAQNHSTENDDMMTPPKYEFYLQCGPYNKLTCIQKKIITQTSKKYIPQSTLHGMIHRGYYYRYQVY